jgi:hypothetical protein
MGEQFGLSGFVLVFFLREELLGFLRRGWNETFNPKDILYTYST